MRSWGLALVLLASGCGGAGTTAPPPGASSPSVGGTYRITQTVLESTCGPIGALPGVGATVQHTPGAGTLVLRDSGGATFNGTVSPSGAFDIVAPPGTNSEGTTFALRVRGTFRATGFDAQLSLDVQPASGGAACRELRSWIAEKDGSPNVLS